jgi:hypothetical protein
MDADSSHPDFAFDVFLSHNSKDKPIVRALAERLRDDGVRVWFDEWQIGFGDSIFSRVEDGLEQSRLLILCMSAHAFASDWAMLETQTVRFRDPLNKDRRFIPLRLDDTQPKGTLGQFLYVDWRTPDDATYARLLAACRPASAGAAQRATPARTPEPTPTKPATTDFAALLESWPHRRDLVQLAFINPQGEPISHAQARSSHQRQPGDEFRARLQTHASGHLVLFSQGSHDGSIMQLLPNNASPLSQTALPAGSYELPGPLLPLPNPQAPNINHLYFQHSGSETLLACLLPALSSCICPSAPLHPVSNWPEIVQAMQQQAQAALAVASISVDS